MPQRLAHRPISWKKFLNEGLFPGVLTTLKYTEEKKHSESGKRETLSHTPGKPTGITPDHSTEALEASRAWSDVFQVLKEKNSANPEHCARKATCHN